MPQTLELINVYAFFLSSGEIERDILVELKKTDLGWYTVNPTAPTHMPPSQEQTYTRKPVIFAAHLPQRATM